MKKLIMIAILICSCVNLVAQRQELSLAGEWQSSLGKCKLPGTTDENRLGGGKHATNVTTNLTRLYPFEGRVTYERNINIPPEMAKMHLSLEMERTKPSTLWIDGDSIGHINQLAAPHIYQLPKLKSGTHHIKILIDNSDRSVPKGVQGSHAWTNATQTNWNGILGRFRILATPYLYIQHLQVYPNADDKTLKIKAQIFSDKAKKHTFTLQVSDKEGNQIKAVSITQDIVKGENTVEMSCTLDSQVQLWSEFHPTLYTATLLVETGKKTTDSISQTFGIRKFSTKGTQFTINGKKTFLRGTHDGCVFPLTGYAPTDVESWRRLFRIAKQYGINHYRFHSYTPTEAAFTAADEEGIYLHTELPFWGTIDKTTTELNDYLLNEAYTTLQYFGNHPSFVSMGLGNELWGDNEMMGQWLDKFRTIDNRHLYNQGSNNDLGYRGPKEGEDFYTTCRVGSGSNFQTNARTSFSFADEDGGGILNALRPNTKANFQNVVKLCKVPIVSHETCQFQIYPDYKEIPKYTGVLYPYNHEIFRDRLKENNLTSQIDAFHDATGRWSIDCYKADMEYCLRTPGFGGFQLLDIKDYPGQGSALCGVLDAFMDSKGVVTPFDFSGWNAPVVPLVEMESFCWSTTDKFSADIVLCNYTEDNYSTPLTWTLYTVDSQGIKTIFNKGEITAVKVLQGNVTKVGNISLSLTPLTHSTQLRLELQSGKYHNYYNLWAYKNSTDDEKIKKLKDVKVYNSVNQELIKDLETGKSILLSPKHDTIEGQSVGGLFTPDYWNYAMFKTISENNHRPISPGTLGMLMNPQHPLFSNFPTEGRSDWQWWSIALNSRPIILNQLTDYLPIIQTVDNVERNHKLGILMEFNVGKGKLLLSSTNLDAISQYTEGKAYVNALKEYISSNDFNPQYTITIDQLRQLLYSTTKERQIKGVKNITDYIPVG